MRSPQSSIFTIKNLFRRSHLNVEEKNKEKRDISGNSQSAGKSPYAFSSLIVELAY